MVCQIVQGTASLPANGMPKSYQLHFDRTDKKGAFSGEWKEYSAKIKQGGQGGVGWQDGKLFLKSVHIQTVRIQPLFKVITLQMGGRATQNIIFLMKADQSNELNIFFEQRLETSIMQPEQREQDCPQSIPYLKKGDSSVYLDQFLAKPTETPASPFPSNDRFSPREDVQSHSKDEDFELEEAGRFNPSAFHNFQKHLTVSLKHAIDLPEDRSGGEYQVAAARLWKHFKNSTVSTKKILHYMLGERNEHPITEAGLKEYGLTKIYDAYGEQTMREARAYLSREALRQIAQGRLEVYISAKKLKDKEKFRRYVEIFVEELENGYLRKRLPKEKVAYLLRN